MTNELVVPKDAPTELIRAAGGIVFRRDDVAGISLACIYREARGDWTFPKGKLDPGESFEEAALREVREETGMLCRIVRFAGATNYTHRKGKPKVVAYYLMSANEGEFTPNDEVDQLVWVPLERVREYLTWERDQELLDRVVKLPELAHARE